MGYKKSRHCCVPPVKKCFVEKEVVKKFIKVKYEPVVVCVSKKKKILDCREVPCRHVPHHSCRPCHSRNPWKTSKHRYY